MRKIFHDRCINAGLRIVYEAVSDDFNLSDYDLILDGLLGTGIKRSGATQHIRMD